MLSVGYEISLGSSLATVGRDGCSVFMCERKVSNLIFYNFSFLFISFYITFFIISNQGTQNKMVEKLFFTYISTYSTNLVLSTYYLLLTTYYLVLILVTGIKAILSVKRRACLD